MKTQDKQILALLQAFHPDMVMKAFELYQGESSTVENDLKTNGWHTVDEKPTDREFYFINNKYWVQTDEARERDKEKALAVMKNKPRTTSVKKTSMGLSLSQLKCPKCQGKMYKQNVCPRCKEGKAGYKIRLICENNPDHEILL